MVIICETNVLLFKGVDSCSTLQDRLVVFNWFDSWYLLTFKNNFQWCAPMFKFENFLTNIDSKIGKPWNRFWIWCFRKKTWLQCSLPVKYGGIGIRSCEDLATPTFLSSIHSTKSLVGSILRSNDGIENNFACANFARTPRISIGLVSAAELVPRRIKQKKGRLIRTSQ